ncbi:MAG TPA: phage baseplate assembly protein V [Polyangium sp.]|nr:phage baseplate assembly protein V [Polyangium sp.]
MSDIVTVLRAIIQDELRSLQFGDIAVVSKAYAHADDDEHNYECDVTLRESGLEIKKVPMATPHIGMASMPQVGDLVYLSYVGGDANRPIVLGRLYSEKFNPPPHKADELHIVSKPKGKASIVIDKDESVIVTAGETVVTIKKDDVITIKGKKDLEIEVDGNVSIKCKDCKVDASGNIDLGSGGGGVITTKSHKCYFTGAALVGSETVKAKG